jgi:Hexameric tyrosine-coordinated heme protein (HTHP)
MCEPWLSTLLTETAQESWELSVKLSRMGVKVNQSCDEIRQKLRPIYENEADSVITSSQVIAINFQTIAAANNYWRKLAD